MQLGTKTEGRLRTLINVAYVVLIIVAFYLYMTYAFWLTFPFLFAFFIALVLQRPVNYAHRKIKLKKGFTSTALVTIFYLLIVLLIVFIGVRLWNGMKDFGSYLSGLVKDLPNIIRGLEQRIYELTAWLPDSIEVSLNETLSRFVESLLSGQNAQGESVGIFNSLISRINLDWFKAPVDGVISIAGRIPSIAIAVVITVIASFFMTTSYDSIVKFIKRQLKPDHRKALSSAKRIVFYSMGKLMRSYLIIIAASFVQLTLGFLLLMLIGVYDGKQLVGIAAITAIVDIFPVLGVGTILAPWALYSLIMGNFGMGIGLLVLWVVMLVIRQVMEPKIMATNLGLPAIVTLMAMYVGLQLFGVLGMLIGPLLVTLLKLLNDEGVVHIWKTTEKPAKVTASGPADPPDGDSPAESAPPAKPAPLRAKKPWTKRKK